MNWQMIVGIFFLIGGIGNIISDFGAFLIGVLLGGAFLYWGLKKKSRTINHNTQKRTLSEEDFKAVGVSYYEKNIQKLACENSDWKLTASKIIAAGKAEKRIFKHNYINKPIKLEFEPNNEHDRNAISVVIAGEKVGYISREENLHVKDILTNREIISISGFIGGGEYKIVSANQDVIKDKKNFSINVRIKYI